MMPSRAGIKVLRRSHSEALRQRGVNGIIAKITEQIATTTLTITSDEFIGMRPSSVYFFTANFQLLVNDSATVQKCNAEALNTNILTLGNLSLFAG